MEEEVDLNTNSFMSNNESPSRLGNDNDAGYSLHTSSDGGLSQNSERNHTLGGTSTPQIPSEKRQLRELQPSDNDESECSGYDLSTSGELFIFLLYLYTPSLQW